MRPGTFSATGAVLGGARAVGQLWRLPAPARRFYRAAIWTAIRRRDGYTLRVSLPPRELSELLDLARGRPRIVELGTANAWTALALASSRPETEVVTLDPRVRPEREAYVSLVAPEARSRVTFLTRRGEDAAERIDVDLLYIDTTHEYELVLACFEQWMPRVVQGGLVVFDDYDHPHFPGPARAVETLKLDGRRAGRMFVWTKP